MPAPRARFVIPEFKLTQKLEDQKPKKKVKRKKRHLSANTEGHCSIL